ncbi:MAG: hypothetical protein AAF290_13230 [Pseudomonadota bacterium]
MRSPDIMPNATASQRQFHERGFVITGPLFETAQLQALCAVLPERANAGTRKMLDEPLIRETVTALRAQPQLAPLIANRVAVQCIYFHKDQATNWSVRLHRDSAFPMTGDGPWPAAGVKEGQTYRRVPHEFARRLCAIRLHLDGAPEGDLTVLAGSHRESMLVRSTAKHRCDVQRGAALVLTPALLHGSAKLDTSPSRRVLHFVFAPRELPYAYSWYDPV